MYNIHTYVRKYILTCMDYQYTVKLKVVCKYTLYNLNENCIKAIGQSEECSIVNG